MSGATFQAAIDRALGAVGRNLGRPYRAYRIAQNSAGDFPTGWQERPGRAALVRNRVTSRDLETNLLSERSLWFELAGDMTAYQLGDVFVSAEPEYRPGSSYGAGATTLPGTIEIDGIAFASHVPMRAPIGARVDRRVGIYRSMLAPVPQQDGSKRWNTTLETDTPLVLSGGTFSWGASGAPPSLVPCGFGSNDREFRGGAFTPDTIGIVPAARYFAYLPPLPGYIPAEGDRIVTEDDARYVVLAPYRQEVGVAGGLFMIERMISAKP